MTEALEITKEEFETNKDDYLDRVEKGEIIIVRHPDGRAVLAAGRGAARHRGNG